MRWVRNDGGRAAAGYGSLYGDCITRSAAIAAELPFADVLALLHRAREPVDLPGLSSPRLYEIFSAAQRVLLTELGWRWVQVRPLPRGRRVYWREGDVPAGRLIVAVGRHFCAVVEGAIHDTHDASGGTGRLHVFGYWTL